MRPKIVQITVEPQTGDLGFALDSEGRVLFIADGQWEYIRALHPATRELMLALQEAEAEREVPK